MNEIINKINIRNLPIILASKSPRRKKLLEQINLNFSIIESDFDEDSVKISNPIEYCQYLALKKAEAVSKNIYYESIIIGCDTIVVLNDEILNKPIDNEDSFKMLKKLSGNTHIVYTGLALINNKTQHSKVFYQSTKVTFRILQDDEIWAYINTGSPLDKAGSYGIQDDYGAVFVSYIDGCYYNIVGLPISLFYTNLIEFLENDL